MTRTSPRPQRIPPPARTTPARTRKPDPTEPLWKDADARIAFRELRSWVTSLERAIEDVRAAPRAADEGSWEEIRLATILGEVRGVASMLRQLAGDDHLLPWGEESALSIATARHLCRTVPHKLYWAARVYGMTPEGRRFPLEKRTDGFMHRLDASVAGVGTESWRPSPIAANEERPC